MKYKYEDLDERIIKTRFALSGAIFELMKTPQKVKVLDICKQADVTPMTYYHHFGNKDQLLEWAVREQLKNKLPIPIKLKPINLKQLIGYLIKTMSEFVADNQQIINNSLNKMNTDGIKHSYINVLLTVTRFYIHQEIKLLINNDPMTLNVLSDVITYSVILLIIKRMNSQQDYRFLSIWNSLKSIRKDL